jgi:hypothetical protein
LCLVGALDDLGRPERLQASRALRASDDGGDVRARTRRDLHGERPDAPGRTGDQHPAPNERPTVTQRAQRRQSRDRQNRRLREIDVLRQNSHAMARRRGALGPAEVIHQCHHAGPDRRPFAIGGLPHHDARYILPRHPAFSIPSKGTQFAGVQRKRSNLNECLVLGRGRFGNFAYFDGCRSFRCIHESEHWMVLLQQRFAIRFVGQRRWFDFSRR